VTEWSAEITVDSELARRLIREQFDQLAAKRVELLGRGWDNTVYLVDDEWVFRFPRREIAVAGVEREIAVLPRLTGLPLAIPEPRLVGARSASFPWPFFGAPHIAGRDLAEAPVHDGGRQTLGAALGGFLRSLHDPARVAFFQELLPADPMGRTDMRQRVHRTRERLEEIAQMGLYAIPSSAADVLSVAFDLPSVPAGVVTHGDLHLRHLLVNTDGTAAGVIDWGDLCRADPSIDLPLYWGALSPAGREAFRDAYGYVGEEQLLRARVLSLFLNSSLAIYARAEGLRALQIEAIAELHRTMVD
jgi:aminoglycoside phosphotransferase (APT) family kinase protein